MRFGRLRLTPRQVERLTETELILCLDDDMERRRSTDGGREVGAADLVEYARVWRAMTLAERLERAKQGGW